MEETPFELIDPPSFPRSEIERLIGTKMKNENVYIRAFTHKSALKKYKGLEGSYETLEFMGDSVLGFIITKFLFDRFEDRQEGFLTKARTKLVRGKTLCEIAERLQLHAWILMDDKGIRNGWNTNANILEDVFEALVGAIYMDLGIIHAKTFVFSAFQSIFESIEKSLADDNYNITERFISKCLLMVFLTVQALEKRKRMQNRMQRTSHSQLHLVLKATRMD